MLKFDVTAHSKSYIILFLFNHTGSYFNPIQLADIARRLDEVEKAHLTEGDIPTTQMLRVMEVRSVD